VIPLVDASRLAQRYIEQDMDMRWMKWTRTGARDLLNYASRWRGLRRAWVLGTGPSLKEVPPEAWAKIRRDFTIGVNRFPLRAEAMGLEPALAAPLPSLCFRVDPMKPCEEDAALNAAYKRQRGKRLVGWKACEFKHDWCVPVRCKSPLIDLEFGLTLTVSIDSAWNRGVIAAAHLAAQIGFREIVLLGCDHGPDYYPNEPFFAQEHWGLMRDFLAPKGFRLLQAGRCAAFNSLEKFDWSSL
jgi:hypothetical protein